MEHRLTPVDVAREHVLAQVAAVPGEDVPLRAALGRVTTRAVVAPHDLPRFDNSAMDGFAVRAADTAGATPDEPVTLEVTAEVAAGSDPLPTIARAQAARIATGAPLPPGADAVVRLERVRIDDGRVHVPRQVAPGADVRRRGEDVHRQDVLVPIGTRLGPGQIAAIAATGAETVEVHRRPRIALVITGDEIAVAGTQLRPGQVFDAVGPSLAAWCGATGASVELEGPVRDEADSLRARLTSAAEASDVVLTVGGVSIGHRDHARAVVDEVSLSGVAVRPGRPFAVGRVGGQLWLGLPGNPAAALVTFSLFVEPALRRLGGYEPADTTVRAVLTTELASLSDRVHVVRARCWEEHDTRFVAPVRGQGAGMVGALARGNALIVVPMGVGEYGPEDRVDVRPLPTAVQNGGS
ncbi:MAG: molybdopterin molybdotransferase MoeA [Actinobacteria bacterium]|nr:molybdopterin molybdotransferase MoeA [Actinomycetota bacterium]